MTKAQRTRGEHRQHGRAPAVWPRGGHQRCQGSQRGGRQAMAGPAVQERLQQQAQRAPAPLGRRLSFLPCQRPACRRACQDQPLACQPYQQACAWPSPVAGSQTGHDITLNKAQGGWQP